MDPNDEGAANGEDGFGPPDARDRLRRLLYAFFFGAVALVFLDPPSDTFAQLSPLFISLFGGSSLLSLRHAFSRKPELELRDDGFVHRASDFGGALFVPWSEIEEIDVSSFWTSATANHVEVSVRDSLSLLRTASPTRWPGILVSRLMHRQRILLRPPSAIAADQVRRALEQRLLLAERRALGIESHEVESTTRDRAL